MKTLNDVINALEKCTDYEAECAGCPYKDENEGGLECVMRNLEEVLGYLKEYRDSKAWLELEKKNYAEAIRNCDKAEAIEAWNKAMSGNVQDCAKDARCSERKWHINFDPYDESTSPKEKGYYRIIEEDGTEKTDFFFGEPRMTGHGIGYWATSEKTIIAWATLPFLSELRCRHAR